MSAVSESEAQVILKKHNCARRRYGAPPLKWDWQLAADAAVHADRCIWAHGSEIGKAPPGQGENLSLAMGKPVTVDGWLAEEKDYDCDDNQCVRNMCGHWTQMIWDGTGRVGCAKKRCSSVQKAPQFRNADYLCCRYTPPGNYVGRRPVRPEQCVGKDRSCGPSATRDPIDTSSANRGGSTSTIGRRPSNFVDVPESQVPSRPSDLTGRTADEMVDTDFSELILFCVALATFLALLTAFYFAKRYVERKNLVQRSKRAIIRKLR